MCVCVCVCTYVYATWNRRVLKKSAAILLETSTLYAPIEKRKKKKKEKELKNIKTLKS